MASLREGIISGEGGIRTHAPFRTNGFQDRLVMTTSIPLHGSAIFGTNKILPLKYKNVNNKFKLFSLLFPELK